LRSIAPQASAKRRNRTARVIAVSGDDKFMKAKIHSAERRRTPPAGPMNAWMNPNFS
jgi:hypothetical protein